MGIPPDGLLAMSLHDYQAALYHFSRANSRDDDEAPLSGGEFDEMLGVLHSEAMH